MPLRRWWERATRTSGQPPVGRLLLEAREWSAAMPELAAAGQHLLALWGARRAPSHDYLVRAAFLGDAGVLVLELPLAQPDAPYPGIEAFFPAASRMQRAVADLWGLRATDPDERPWLRHAAWPVDFFPLREPAVRPPPPAAAPLEPYPFLRVDGEGVHEIPVGPVHAGIIEPGHFRFSVVGEKVLKLEERLGYTHKGIERRFTELPILEGHRLAARVSGDSGAAFSWAYCQALERMAGANPPARALWLRALCLELERLANHLGDLGALGNDAGFAFGLAQFSRLKEELLRATDQAFGQRYLLDTVVPGGIRVDLSLESTRLLEECLLKVAREAQVLREIYDEHGGVRDRFLDAGRVTPELAARLGMVGLAGRASGRALDMRVAFPCEPYASLAAAMMTSAAGDVAARVAVRFDELQESCRLGWRILGSLPAGPCRIECKAPADGVFGIGLIEGWRGPVFLALEAGPKGSIRSCHPHDPSWQNWPVLEHAVIGNIVPDFPLINKSFNLSYSGHDL